MVYGSDVGFGTGICSVNGIWLLSIGGLVVCIVTTFEIGYFGSGVVVEVGSATAGSKWRGVEERHLEHVQDLVRVFRAVLANIGVNIVGWLDVSDPQEIPTSISKLYAAKS